jgi:hypothetical protein
LQEGLSIKIVERTGIASSSGGKGGGFLAKNWSSGSPTNVLSVQGFNLHNQLSQELGIKSYRMIKTLQLEVQ